MTKKETERRARQLRTLQSLGFTDFEADKLRRISITLQRWHELECGIDGGVIERDDDTGRPFWRSETTGRKWPVADRETGAHKRLARIMAARDARLGLPSDAHNWRCDDGTFDIVDDEGEVVRQNVPAHAALLRAYVQTDPRGAALYILRPGDVPDGKDPASYYSRGVCVW